MYSHSYTILSDYGTNYQPLHRSGFTHDPCHQSSVRFTICPRFQHFSVAARSQPGRSPDVTGALLLPFQKILGHQPFLSDFILMLKCSWLLSLLPIGSCILTLSSNYLWDLLFESLHDSRPMLGAGSSSGVELFQVFMSTRLWQDGADQQVFHGLFIPTFARCLSILVESPFLLNGFASSSPCPKAI